MVTPSSDALFVLNGKTKSVNCKIDGVPQTKLILWTKSTKLHQQTKF